MHSLEWNLEGREALTTETKSSNSSHKQSRNAQKARNKMVLRAYSMRDSKSEIFHPPFFKSTHGEAERDFRSAVNDDKTMLSKYPEDFDLYYIGVYDNNTGKFDPLDTPQHVLKAIQCVTTPEQ